MERFLKRESNEAKTEKEKKSRKPFSYVNSLFIRLLTVSQSGSYKLSENEKCVATSKMLRSTGLVYTEI